MAKDALGEVKKKIDEVRAYRSASKLTARWEVCYQYYIGNHWRSQLPSQSQQDGDQWQKHPQIVMNISLNMVESVLSSLMAQAPLAYVLPCNSADEEARFWSDAFTAAVARLWDEQDYQRQASLGVKISLIYGIGHLKVRWNKPGKGENGEEGQIALEPVTPFGLLVDPHATCLDDAQYLIQQRDVPQSVVEGFLEAKGGAPPGEEAAAMPLATHRGRDVVRVYEAWLERGKRVVWMTEDRLIADQDNPYEHQEFPYTRLVDTEVPDSYDGLGVIWPILPLQREINERRSQAVIYSRFYTYGNLVVTAGHVKGVERLTNEPGQIIELFPGGEYRRDMLPPMPAHLQSMPQQTMMDAQRVLGIWETAQGSRPYAVTAGRAIETLTQVQSQRLEGAKARPLEAALKRVGRQVVALMSQFYTPQRLLESADLSVDEMTLANLDKIPKFPFLIKVEPGATLAVNKVARFQMALQLFQLRLLSDEDVLRALDWPGWREIVAKRQQAALATFSEAGAGQMRAGGEGLPPEQRMEAPQAGLKRLPVQEIVGRLAEMRRGQT